MKKKILLLFTIVAAMGSALAQDVDPSKMVDTPIFPHKLHWSFGVLGGYDQNYHIVDMSYMSGMKYDAYTPGRTFGLQVGYSPAKWLTFRLDAVMIQKNYNMVHVFQYYNMRYSMTNLATNEYVNVPLVAMLNVGKKVRLHAFGGGYVGYWLSGHRSGQSYSMSYSITGDESTNVFDQDYEFSEVRDNRRDAGFTWGAGLSGIIAKHFELGAEVRWYYGILDIQNDYMRNLSPRYNTTFVIQGGVCYWL